MHLPRALARFNRRVTNPIQRRWAGVLPGYGIVEHVGRKSGHRYRTPVNIYPAHDGFVISLFYGTETDWVRNLTAAGHGELVHRGRRYALSNPHIVSGAEGRALLPRPVRLISRLVRNDNVLHVSATPG
jgi:deazaflavin-dependent oxidoreductase (nitroreductase family)